MPLAEHPRLPVLARVLPPSFSIAWGQQAEAIDHHLIERRSTPHTASGSSPTDNRGPHVGRFELPSRVPEPEQAGPGTDPPDLSNPRPNFFFWKHVRFKFEFETYKFEIEIYVHPNGVIQISVDSLFKYLSYSTGPCKIDPCMLNSILTCKTGDFSIKNPKFEFCQLKWHGYNFQRCSDVLACMSHWIWYFRTHIPAVVFKIANRLNDLL
jgi:hypothetical protein